MSDPISAIVIGSAVVGGGAQVAGDIQQGNAAYKQGMYQAQVSANNAIVAENNAVAALKKGASDAEQQRRDNAANLGQTRAALAALGQVLGTGTALGLVADRAQLGETQVQRILTDAQNDAVGFRSQGADYRAQASMERSAANSALSASRVQAVGSIFSAAGNIYGKVQDYKKGLNVPKGKP